MRFVERVLSVKNVIHQNSEETSIYKTCQIRETHGKIRWEKRKEKSEILFGLSLYYS